VDRFQACRTSFFLSSVSAVVNAATAALVAYRPADRAQSFKDLVGYVVLDR